MAHAQQSVVGIVKPSSRPGKYEDLVKLLPPSVKLVQNGLGIYRGSQSELVSAIDNYGPCIAELAQQRVDLVHPAGAPLLLLGYHGERRRVEAWEDQYNVPIFTNGMSQAAALHAFGAKRIVGATYFPGDINASFARYYREAGFDVLDMVGMDVEFQAVPSVPSEQVYDFIRAQVLKNKNADALYLLGPAWKTQDSLARMEREFGIPVVHHTAAESWEIQRRFHLRHPVTGYGRLLEELPQLSEAAA
jgi:maleate isomerase